MGWWSAALWARLMYPLQYEESHCVLVSLALGLLQICQIAGLAHSSFKGPLFILKSLSLTQDPLFLIFYLFFFSYSF